MKQQYDADGSQISIFHEYIYDPRLQDAAWRLLSPDFYNKSTTCK